MMLDLMAGTALLEEADRQLDAAHRLHIEADALRTAGDLASGNARMAAAAVALQRAAQLRDQAIEAEAARRAFTGPVH